MPAAPTCVAIAILYRENRFLMQLRDNLPGIVYGGYWGFFGGHIEVGETAAAALIRELQEEIEYTPTDFTTFGCYPDQGIIRHVFHGPLTRPLHQLTLHEGWDMALLSPADIQRGRHYSSQAAEERPLAPIHQRILLDFLKSQP